MEFNISKELVLKIINSEDFKQWLINRRWFGEKSLTDFKIKLKHLYIFPLTFLINNHPKDYNFIFTVISIDSDKEITYFLPLCFLKSFDSLNIDSKSLNLIKQKLLKLDLGGTLKEIMLFEAEFFPNFWNIIFSEFIQLNSSVDINCEYFSDKIKNLSKKNLTIAIQELGSANTTNIVLKLNLNKKNNKNNPKNLFQLVIKSYRKYKPQIEVEMLKTLNGNKFDAVPTILGLVKFKQLAIISIMNFIENQGDVGLIYWNDLNDLFDFYLSNPIELSEKEFEKIKDQVEMKLIDYCKKSIKTSERLGFFLKKMHNKLIIDESENFKLEIVNKETINYLQSQFKSLISEIISSLNFLKESHIINDEKIIELLVNLTSKMDNRDYFLKIQDSKAQRIHQDLHMAQILIGAINNNSELIITDFEGDPQLSIMEQRKKYPVEKDIASLLRSLDYIKLFSLIDSIKHFINETSNQISKKILFSLYQEQKPAALYVKDYIFLKNLVNVGKYWQLFISDSIIRNYYKSDVLSKMKKYLINLFSIQRCLMELNYEIKFRPENIIIPLLGLKGIFPDKNFLLSISKNLFEES